MGAPEATVLSAKKSQSGGTFELTVKFYQQNAGGEVTVNQSARMTLEKVGGKYFDYRILSLAKSLTADLFFNIKKGTAKFTVPF